jgi:hypothetical protein
VLNNQTIRVYRGHRVKALHALDLGTRWSYIVNFMLQAFYPDERAHDIHWMMLCQPQNYSECSGRKKYLIHVRNKTLFIQYLLFHKTFLHLLFLRLFDTISTTDFM